jgi:ABC-type branched-subunit amino acid transport system substrate-binding protein
MTWSARPRGLRIATGAAAVAVGILATACSSSSTTSSPASQPASGPSGSASSAPAAAGSVIKLGIIATAGTAVNQAPAVAAAQAAVRDVNAHGGINGHQVQLVFCNESLDPNVGRACARTLVSDHVLAAVGNQIITVESDDEAILSAAGIANVGPYSYGGFADTDPNSYMLYPGPQFSNAAMAAFAVKSGRKRVAMLQIDLPTTTGYVALISKTVQALGGTYAGTVTVPQVTSDLSAQAAALMSMNPDAVILNAGTPAELSIMKDMTQLGYQGKFVANGGQPELQSQLTALGSVANSLLSVSPFPPLSSTNIPGITRFRSDMTAEAAAGDSNAPTATGYVANNDIDAWLSVIAVAQIANAAKATDAASFKTAIGQATNVDLDGLIAAWTPNKTAAAGAIFPRASNAAFYFTTWHNGEMTMASSGTTDVTSLVNKYAPHP